MISLALTKKKKIGNLAKTKLHQTKKINYKVKTRSCSRVARGSEVMENYEYCEDYSYKNKEIPRQSYRIWNSDQQTEQLSVQVNELEKCQKFMRGIVLKKHQ